MANETLKTTEEHLNLPEVAGKLTDGSEKVNSLRDKINKMELEFTHIETEFPKQQFEQAFQSIQSFVEDTEKNRNSLNAEEFSKEWDEFDEKIKSVQKILDDHKEILGHRQVDLLTLKSKFKGIINKKIENNFEVLYQAALESYKKATKEQNNLNESQLEYGVLQSALKLVGKISEEQKNRIEKLEKDFDKCKKDAEEQRVKEDHLFIEKIEKKLNEILLMNQSRSTLPWIIAEMLAFRFFDSLILEDNDKTVNEKEKENEKEKLLELLKTEIEQYIAMRQQKGHPVDPKLLTSQQRVTDGLSQLRIGKMTENVGNPNGFKDALQAFINKNSNDVRSPEFVKLLSDLDQHNTINAIDRWNHFATKYGTAIDNKKMTQKMLDEMLKSLKDDFLCVPESNQLVVNKKKYVHCYLQWLAYHSLFAEILSKLEDLHEEHPNLFLIQSIHADIERLQNTFDVAIAETWQSEILKILNKIVQNQKTDPIIQLVILKTVTISLAQEDLFFLKITSDWRSHYGSAGFDPNVLRCRRNKPCHIRYPYTVTHQHDNKTGCCWLVACDICYPYVVVQRQIAESLLAEYPIKLMQMSVRVKTKYNPKIALLPAHDKIGVEYFWIGWLDRDNANASNLITRINADKLPAKVNNGDLYAVLPDRKSVLQPPHLLLQKIGDLKDGKGEIDADSQDLLLGTPVYLRYENE
jgi:hypothetical protein